MNVSIIHPTRGRVEQAKTTANNWLSKADNPHGIEYLLSVDKSDQDVWRFDAFGVPFGVPQVLVNDNHSAIEAINNAARVCTGDLIVVVSDDFDCPKHWDTLLLRALEGREDFCVKTNDGAQNFIITLPILDRTYYNRFGYIYNPAYHHMFCDTEMSCVAWMLDKYVEVPLTFKHNHYTTGAMQKDAINEKNDSTWEQGKEVFKKRYYENFGINPVRNLPEHSGIAKYMRTI